MVENTLQYPVLGGELLGEEAGGGQLLQLHVQHLQVEVEGVDQLARLILLVQ